MSFLINKATGEKITRGAVIAANKDKSLPEVWTQEVLDELGVAEFVFTAPPAHSASEIISEGVPEIRDGKAFQTWVKVERTFASDEERTQFLALLKADLHNRSAAKRYAVEVGGVTLQNGTKIATDRESQAKVSGALVYLSNNPSAGPITWKSETGWITVDLPTLDLIAKAVGSHVQACFVAEKAHFDAIEQIETLEEAATYDLESGWPAN